MWLTSWFVLCIQQGLARLARLPCLEYRKGDGLTVTGDDFLGGEGKICIVLLFCYSLPPHSVKYRNYPSSTCAHVGGSQITKVKADIKHP